MRKSQLVAILILIAPLMLTACGQKGPLFISADEPAQATDAVAAEQDAQKQKSQSTSY
jgi:predicted small lipoprotein YifL